MRILGIGLLIICWDVFALMPLNHYLDNHLLSINEIERSLIEPYEFVSVSNKYSLSALNSDRSELQRYLGFIQEGENLKLFCEKKYNIEFPSNYEKKQVLNTIVSNLQWVGLKKSISSLAALSKKLELDEDMFVENSKNLINGYCSENLQIASQSELLKQFNFAFNNEKFGKFIPGEKPNYFQPLDSYSSSVTQRAMYERQYELSKKLFKYFCSWGHQSSDYRMLSPFLRDPLVMGHINRIVGNRKLFWDPQKNKAFLGKHTVSHKVLCSSNLCRIKNSEQFSSGFPRITRTLSRKKELDILYCTYFEGLSFKIKKDHEKIKDMYNKKTKFEDRILVSHFVSLLTNVPDFIQHINSYSELSQMLRAGINSIWTNWAHESLRKVKDYLYYEESLTYSPIKNLKLNSGNLNDLKVYISVDYGEGDKSFSRQGKIKVHFPIVFKYQYAKWIVQKWRKNLSYDSKDQRKKILVNLRLNIKQSMLKAQSKFSKPIWGEQLDELLATQIMDQLEVLGDRILQENNYSDLKIPVELSIGVNALKYLGQRL